MAFYEAIDAEDLDAACDAYNRIIEWWPEPREAAGGE